MPQIKYVVKPSMSSPYKKVATLYAFGFTSPKESQKMRSILKDKQKERIETPPGTPIRRVEKPVNLTSSQGFSEPIQQLVESHHIENQGNKVVSSSLSLETPKRGKTSVYGSSLKSHFYKPAVNASLIESTVEVSDSDDSRTRRWRKPSQKMREHLESRLRPEIPATVTRQDPQTIVAKPEPKTKEETHLDEKCDSCGVTGKLVMHKFHRTYCNPCGYMWTKFLLKNILPECKEGCDHSRISECQGCRTVALNASLPPEKRIRLREKDSRRIYVEAAIALKEGRDIEAGNSNKINALILPTVPAKSSNQSPSKCITLPDEGLQTPSYAEASYLLVSKPRGAVLPSQRVLTTKGLKNENEEQSMLKDYSDEELERSKAAKLDYDWDLDYSEDEEPWNPKIYKRPRMKIKTKFVSSSNSTRKSGAGGSRKPRCGNCSGCRADNCTNCLFCEDMKKYGGPGRMKQCCIDRRCIYKNEQSRPPKYRDETEGDYYTPASKRSRSDSFASIIGSGRRKSRPPKRYRPDSATSSVGDESLATQDSAGTQEHDFAADDQDILLETILTNNPFVDLLRVSNRNKPTEVPPTLTYCSVCCDPFHDFCLEERDRPKSGDGKDWLCRNCRFCQVCGMLDDLLTCDRCCKTYHPECLRDGYAIQPTSAGIWVCNSCVKCTSCGATTPGGGPKDKWNSDFSLCASCQVLRLKGNYCPICRLCYTDDDWDCKMIFCATCESWSHSKCENLPDDLYQLIGYVEDDESQYVCKTCLVASNKPLSSKPEWLVALEKLRTEGFSIVRASFLKKKEAQYVTNGDEPQLKTFYNKQKAELIAHQQKRKRARNLSPSTDQIEVKIEATDAPSKKELYIKLYDIALFDNGPEMCVTDIRSLSNETLSRPVRSSRKVKKEATVKSASTLDGAGSVRSKSAPSQTTDSSDADTHVRKSFRVRHDSQAHSTPGSPFKRKVGGATGINEESMLTTQQKAADVIHVGSVCELSLKSPGSDPMEMVASFTSPSGITELCDMDSTEDHYTIKFVPKEMGPHSVSVKHKGLSIPGSPFLFTVGPITEGGAHRVHASGPGLERGEVDVRNEFNIYTREAGSGGLAISVEGPSKADIKFEDKHDGSNVVSYLCTDPGEYVVSVKFNDEHIPDSPFRVPVLPSSGDARKVTVQSMKQQGLEIGKPASFTCMFNGARGDLHARVVAPSGAEDEGLVQSLDDSDSRHAIRFIPRENGVHFVHVTLDRSHIRGSPFKVIVGEQEPDPGAVTASGPGLKKAETGFGKPGANQSSHCVVETEKKTEADLANAMPKLNSDGSKCTSKGPGLTKAFVNKKAQFSVDSSTAGQNMLFVGMIGPANTPPVDKILIKHAQRNTYNVSYTVKQKGKYHLLVKWGNDHVPGSPFNIDVV